MVRYYWVVKLGPGKWLVSWDIRRVIETKVLNRAHRYEDKEDAEFVAGRVKGTAVRCREYRGKMEEIVT